ncbi:MAG: hypothetical protein M1839_004425 [Geoglossum umbratile]|nr:MAG: hypothetical protein M1839_004425 [Geoglossum umbratile]
MTLMPLLGRPLFLFLIISEQAFVLAQAGTGTSQTTLSSPISSGRSTTPSAGFDGTSSTWAAPPPPSSTATSVLRTTQSTTTTTISSRPSQSLQSSSTTDSTRTIATSTSTPAPSVQQHMSPVQRRNLILILALGLGSVFTAVLVWLWCGLRRRRNTGAPLFARTSTPIDDEEIQTWRKQVSITSASGSHSAEGINSPNAEWMEKLPMTPTTAKAPNARMGLTDEIVPGEEPFIPLPKRSTSRGLHRPKHMRTKSARSSISDRPPTPYTVEEGRAIIPPTPRMPGAPGKEPRPESH